MRRKQFFHTTNVIFSNFQQLKLATKGRNEVRRRPGQEAFPNKPVVFQAILFRLELFRHLWPHFFRRAVVVASSGRRIVTARGSRRVAVAAARTAAWLSAESETSDRSEFKATEANAQPILPVHENLRLITQASDPVRYAAERTRIVTNRLSSRARVSS